MTRARPLHVFLGWLLRRVLRYRLPIVRTNLSRAFPDLTTAARNVLLKGFYVHLARVILETLSDASKAKLDHRIDYASSPEVAAWLAAGRSVIATMGHMGNWEWTGAFLGNIHPDHFCALYRKIKNTRLNRIQFNRRSRHARYLLEARQTGDMLRLLKSQTVILLLIADQNPGNDQGLAWVPFFGRPTAFTTGPEQIALRFRLPVVYLHTIPLPNGRYSFRWEVLWDGASPVSRGDITREYAARLEANIREAPEAWLWSHRRWKRPAPDTAA